MVLQSKASDNGINKSIKFSNKLTRESVVCLMAPTASGKTNLAYELYDTGKFEIVSVDSALIYRDMNIGTAKPSQQELDHYPHHLVNIIDPTETYSVANFVADVEKIIKQIHGRGKIPLLVGGTMMYYKTMLTGLSPVPETDPLVRQDVEQWRQREGIQTLHLYLQQVDPVIAKRLNPTDTQRITRAVEVFKQTQKPLSDWQKMPKVAISDNQNQFWLAIAVMPDRAWLHQRIERRLDIMWQQGFFEEVLNLIKKYHLTLNHPSMRCVGYRQVYNYLIEVQHPIIKSMNDGHVNHTQDTFYKQSGDKAVACQDMKNRALYATRQLAKRQYTWLRSLLAEYASVQNSVDALIVDLSLLNFKPLSDNCNEHEAGLNIHHHQTCLSSCNYDSKFMHHTKNKIVLECSTIEEAREVLLHCALNL